MHHRSVTTGVVDKHDTSAMTGIMVVGMMTVVNTGVTHDVAMACTTEMAADVEAVHGVDVGMEHNMHITGVVAGASAVGGAIANDHPMVMCAKVGR